MRAARMYYASMKTAESPARERRTQAERSATTRSALVSAARQLFAEQGYAGTGREEIAARAGVTRGALYHHFDSKADVFSAVVQSVDDELAARVVASAAARRGRRADAVIRSGARAYIEACAEADVARIMVDARSVLGDAALRTMSASTCQALVRAGLEQAAAEGADLPGDVDVLAGLVLAVLDEAALTVVSGAAARATVTKTVDALLARLLGP